ncbi:MAG: ABC transporter ATP-binding protein [Oligoflexia bacterium]|nr:ABC transporter ATP-binding protein [Oligoflexia bacterium]
MIGNIEIQNLKKRYKLFNSHRERISHYLMLGMKKNYQEFWALKGIDFKINKGETVGVIGKNGSGKSTLLKVITGIITPTEGKVKAKGAISALLELGAGLNPELTGIENIYFNGHIAGLTKKEIKGKLDEIVKFADIGDFINQPVKRYSSGMFIRLAFSLSINSDPDILIVDEALAVGDLAFQYKCFDRFNKHKSASRTIIFVTHALDQVIQYCDRAILLNEGELIIDGTPKEAVDGYKKVLSGNKATRIVTKKIPEKIPGEIPEEIPEKKIATKSHATSNINLELHENWKKKFKINSQFLEYGNKEIEIIDFGIFDEKNQATHELLNGEYFFIRLKLKFNHDFSLGPIVAFTIKDLKGLEVAGTNTLYEKRHLECCENGKSKIVEFKQSVNLKSGSYALSLGVTAFQGGDLVVYHRLYDVLLFEVISIKQFVGFFDLRSEVRIEN